MKLNERVNSLKWRKVLYERQPFSDEYSGGSEFLKELRTNISVAEYSFLEAVCGGSRVAVHYNAAVCYYLAFNSTETVGGARCLKLLALLSPGLYLAFACLAKPGWAKVIDHAHTCVTLSCFGYALTPIVRTLTDTISTDTIHAMWLLLMLLSFVFQDYALSAPMVSTILSVNLSLAASVCLVSRVESDEIAFGLLALSLFLFSYWPQIRNNMFVKWPNCALYMELISSPVLFYYLHGISLPLCITYAMVHFIIVIICPWILIKMQPLKSIKHGPWDEATANFLR